jgi:hypothetical protein
MGFETVTAQEWNNLLQTDQGERIAAFLTGFARSALALRPPLECVPETVQASIMNLGIDLKSYCYQQRDEIEAGGVPTVWIVSLAERNADVGQYKKERKLHIEGARKRDEYIRVFIPTRSVEWIKASYGGCGFHELKALTDPFFSNVHQVLHADVTTHLAGGYKELARARLWPIQSRTIRNQIRTLVLAGVTLLISGELKRAERVITLAELAFAGNIPVGFVGRSADDYYRRTREYGLPSDCFLVLVA